MDTTDRTLCLLTERVLEEWARDTEDALLPGVNYLTARRAIDSARQAQLAIGRALDDIMKWDDL